MKSLSSTECAKLLRVEFKKCCKLIGVKEPDNETLVTICLTTYDWHSEISIDEVTTAFKMFSQERLSVVIDKFPPLNLMMVSKILNAYKKLRREAMAQIKALKKLEALDSEEFVPCPPNLKHKLKQYAK